MNDRALAGRRIAVTRPAAQAGELAALIRSAGGEALLWPLLDIAPADPAPLQAVAPRLAQAALAIFISPNAVHHALPALRAQGVWPQDLQTAAIGPGTVRALAECGVAGALAPEQRFDSEGLLELPGLQAAALAGRKVVIFRGDGGRELLAETLTARGAEVEAVSCYRRSPPAAGFADWQRALCADGIDALTVSSSEGLRHLCAGVAGEALARLRALPCFVPHQRIADSGEACGMRRIVLTGAADAGIFAALCAYNWSRP